MTTKQLISVTRALSELKVLDARISKLSTRPVVFRKVAGVVMSQQGITVETLEANVKADFQSLTDLINRRTSIKSAIVRSNAVTTVVVGSKTMTVAEAIELKTSIATKEFLLHNLRSQYANLNTQIETQNAEATRRLDQMLEANLGKDRKVDPTEYDAIAVPFMKKNQASLIDPIGVNDVIKSLETEVDEFKMNVDFALSEVNAMTKIEV